MRTTYFERVQNRIVALRKLDLFRLVVLYEVKDALTLLSRNNSKTGIFMALDQLVA